MAEVEDSAAQALVNKVVALTAELVQTQQRLNLALKKIEELSPKPNKKQTSEK